MATVEISCEPPITQEEVGRTNVNTENMQGDDGNNTEEHQSVEPPMAQEKVCRTNVNSENMQEDDGSNTEEHQSMEPPLTQDKTGHTNVNTENMQGDCDSNIEEDQSVEDTVLYKQSDHLHNISSKLKAFREQGIMCDVEINLGATRMLAHKCVLAAGSSKLNSLLADSAHDVPIKQVNIPTKCPKSFKHLIDYLYTGCLSVSLSNLSELVHLGDALEIPGILSLCCRHLEESLNVENWSTIFHLANALDLDLVLESVKNFAVDYFSFLSSSDDFVELDYNFFKTLISKCNIENDCDLEIFKIKEILQWVSHETDRACHMEDLMEFVNLQNIDPISGLDSVVSLLSLQTHVLENPAYKRFCDNVEMERERTHKNTVVNTDNIYAKQAGVEPANGVRNVKEEDETANGSDIESDAVGVNEDPADCNGEIISSRQKRIRPNLNIRYTDLEAEDASEQKNKRKSFKPKRLRSLYKTKVKGTTGRPRGRPSKKSKPEKKPRMKTSCTQVASANIDEEFEEIAREEREKEEGIECENDEDLPKLETVDQIKLEPEDQKRGQARLRCVRVRKKKGSAKRKPNETVDSRNSRRESNSDSDDSDTEVEYETVLTLPPEAHPDMKVAKRSHRRNRTGDRPDVLKDSETQKFSCLEPNCSFSSRFRGSLLRHKQTMHDKTHVRCKLCGSIVMPEDLEDHHKRFHNMELMCGECGKLVKSTSELRNHTLQYHTDPKEFKYECSHCGKRFHHKSNYQGHMDSHNDVKSWLCQLCHKGFSFRSSLLRHVKICKGKKPKKRTYPCESCGLIFKLKDYLNQHMIGKHSGELKYPCVCGRNFAWRGSLVNHKKTCTVALALKVQKTEKAATPTPDGAVCDVKVKVIKQSQDELAPPSNDNIGYLTVSDPTAIMQDMGISIQNAPQPYQVVQSPSVRDVLPSPSIETFQAAANSPVLEQTADTLSIQAAVINTQLLQPPLLLQAPPQALNSNTLQTELAVTQAQGPAIVQASNVEMTQSAISYGMQLPVETMSSLLLRQLQPGTVIVPLSTFQQTTVAESTQLAAEPQYTLAATTQYTFHQSGQSQWCTVFSWN